MRTFNKTLLSAIAFFLLFGLYGFSQINPPWNEGFEGIATVNEMPTGMTATSVGTKVFTYLGPTGQYGQAARTGTKFASFQYSCNDWIFSPSLNLNGGTTYTVSYWYVTDGTGTWFNLDAHFGISPSAGSMTYPVTGATLANPTATTYTQITGTFTPPSTGIYYLGIYCNANATPWYMTIDDISVTSGGCTPPTLSGISASPVCGSGPSTLTATPSAGIVKWYTQATGGTFIGTGNTFNTGFLSIPTTFYAEADDTGCISIARVPVNVSVFPLPTATAGPTSQNTCIGSSVNLGGSPTVTGGTSPYSFNWSANPAGFTSTLANPSVTPSVNTQYTLTVTDANNCVAIPPPTMVNVMMAPTVTEIVNPVTCNSLNNGSISLTVTGGTTPYTYTWQHGSTMQNVTGLAAGNYFVTVTDANGCFTPRFITVNQPTALTAAITPTNASCNGAATGSATVTASGGVSPYTYLWSGGQTTVTASGLVAGTYIVTITDNNGCQVQVNTTVTQPVALTANAGTTGTICNGGSIVIGGSPTASGGTAGYTYNWSSVPAGFTSSIANPPVSPTANTTYHIAITDANGCTANASVNITVNATPDVIATPASETICSGGNTNISLSSTIGGATFSWTVTAPNITGATTGSGASIFQVLTTTGTIQSIATYNVTAAANGCGSSATPVTVTVNPTPLITVTPASQTVCSGNPVNFSFTSSVTGTVFSWTANTSGVTGATPGSGTNLSQNLSVTGAQGTVTYVVTGTATSCNSSPANATATVNPLPAITSAVKTDVSVCGGSDGTITITATGDAPLTYSIDGGVNFVSNGGIFSGLLPGSFPIYVKNTFGCAVTGATITVNDALPPPAPATSAGSTYCSGASVADITATPSQGGALTWYSDPGLTNIIGTGTNYNPGALVAGTYYYYVIETTGGCQGPSSTVAITVYSLPAAYAGPDVSVCSGQSATLTATGGNAYTWSNGATTALITVSPSVSATYTVTVSDANGCSGTDSIQIIVQSLSTPPSGILAANNAVICLGNTETLSVQGGTLGDGADWFWYSGTPGGTFEGNGVSINVSPATNKIYYVRAEGTCNSTASAPAKTVYVETPPIANAGTDGTICSGNSYLPGGTIGGSASYAIWSTSGTGTFDNIYLTNPTYTPSANDILAGTVILSVTTDQPGICSAPVDSMVLTINPAPTANAGADQTICSGQSTNLTASGGTSYLWNNGATTASITVTPANSAYYTVTVTDANGCSAVDSIYLFVNAIPNITANPPAMTICSGTTASISLSSSVGGAVFNWTVTQSAGISGGTNSSGPFLLDNLINTGTSPGTVTYTITATANGCMGAPINVVVTVNPVPMVTATPASQTICSGQTTNISLSSNIAGTNYSWTVAQTGVSGASSGNTNIIMDMLSTLTSVSGTATYTIAPVANGCTGSTINAIISVNPISAITLTQTSCDSYTLNGTVYTSSGTYTQTLTNAAGCDSVITLNLTINNSSASTLTQTACDLYLLNGSEYVTSGVYTQTLVNAAGCDSIITLNLTINASTSSVLTQTACDSYTLNGTVYTSSGTYTQTLTNASGCDSVITLNLTINNSSASTLTQTACDLYLLNGSEYVTSGVYTQTLVNAAGCDSIITLNLTINASTSSVLTQTACDSYTLNGTVYTSSGTYSQTLTNASGCDSVITLNLTINNSSASTITQSACDLFLLNGSEYVTSGVYTQTLVNAAGCDSIITLNLTINASTSSVLMQTACDSYTLNGTVYTSSGTYTQTLINASGCDSLITLNLTINNSSSASLTQTACDSYTLNSQTYTSSGTYTQTLVNTAGCDSLITLNLTINQSTGSTIQEAICEGQTFTFGSQTLSVTGIYYETLLNSNGCDSVVTLNLTVNPLPQVSFTGLPATICAIPQYFMLIGNQVPAGIFSGTGMTNNGFNPGIAGAGSHTITYSFTDGNGCAAVTSQTINVNPNPGMQVVSSTQTTCGNANGSVTVTGVNGTGGYSYNWSNGNTNPSLSGLASGVYSVTITDGAGCPGAASVNISSSDGPVISVDTITNSSCNYSYDGTANISVTGGVEPYTYQWTGGETTEDALHLTEGTNAVTITDVLGCSSVALVQTISTYGTPVIFGNISYSGGYIDGQYASLKIFSLVNNSQGGYDTTMLDAAIGSDGSYVLYNFEPGQYILKVILNAGNPYAGLLNSYYTTLLASTSKWFEATPVTLACGQDVEANIVMNQQLNNGTGNGLITGTIVQNNVPSKSKGVHINPAKLAGEPVPGAEIYVELEPDDQPIANTETDTSGFYAFEELPEGDFSIRVEIPGFPMVSTYQVVITPTDTSHTDLDFIVDYSADSGFVDTALVYINKEKTEAISISVYPNPFVETLHVHYHLSASKEISIDVFDATGRMIETTGKVSREEGDYVFPVEAGERNLMPGTYFIRVRVDNTIYLKKIVKGQ